MIDELDGTIKRIKKQMTIIAVVYFALGCETGFLFHVWLSS